MLRPACGVVRVAFTSCLQTAFFRQHGCSTNDTNAKYNSRAAQMYREKIRQLANAALSKYGTDVSLKLFYCHERPNTSVLVMCYITVGCPDGSSELRAGLGAVATTDKSR